MNADSRLDAFKEHIANCRFCHEVLTQICGHTPGPAVPSQTEYCARFDGDQSDLLARVQGLLDEAARLLGDPRLAGESEIGNLGYLIRRVRVAASHLLRFGHLNDSDLAMAGYFCKKKLPTNMASMPEEKKLRTASRGVQTSGSPNRLKEVL